MQGLIAWSIVLMASFILLGFSWNMYRDFFADAKVVSEDMQSHIQYNYNSNIKKNEFYENSSTRRTSKINRKDMSLSYNKNNMYSQNLNLDDSYQYARNYKPKYNSYKEFKKYNNVSK